MIGIDRYARLSQRLGYQFSNVELLQQALTHRSAAKQHNERLEFLGDGLLNALVGAALYGRRPRDDEGALSRLRASLVRESTLAGIARDFDLGAVLQLGESERKSGGHRRDSLLADALEAVLGAIWLDAGFDEAQRCCLRWFEGLMDALPDPELLKDAKTRLQEWLQARGRPLPQYAMLTASGPPHRRRFVVRVSAGDAALSAEAEGGSRREAEQRAAHALLISLGVPVVTGPEAN